MRLLGEFKTPYIFFTIKFTSTKKRKTLSRQFSPPTGATKYANACLGIHAPAHPRQF